MSLREALAGGGGVKSIQTGYVSVAPVSGTAEDSRYTDITISAVDASKCAVSFEGGLNGGTNTPANSFLRASNANNAWGCTGRVLNSTTLRIASPATGGTIAGRWQVVEYK